MTAEEYRELVAAAWVRPCFTPSDRLDADDEAPTTS